MHHENVFGKYDASDAFMLQRGGDSSGIKAVLHHHMPAQQDLGAFEGWADAAPWTHER